MKAKKYILAALLVVFALASVNAIFTYSRGVGIFIWQDKAVEPGSVFFVNSSTGTDNAGCGRNPSIPCDTIDYAIGLCTANAGDIIYVMPAYVQEGTSTEAFDADVAGISIIGLGTGDNRPRIDYNYATDYVSIGAANVTIKNLIFRPGVTSTAVAINIEAAGDAAVIEGCEFAVGEASGTDEFVSAITIAATANDVVIRNNEFRTAITDNGCVQAVYIGTGGACARTHIENNYMYGNWSTAAIVDSTTAQTELAIHGNRIKVKDGEPAVELTATSTGIISKNLIESTGITASAAIVAADCSWIDNQVVNADGEASTQIGEDKGVGSMFYTLTTIAAGASVVTTGMALTGASSGVLQLVDVTVAVGATTLDSSGHAASLALYTDNAKGTDPFFTVAQAALTANDNASLNSYTFTQDGDTVVKTVYGGPIVLETGKYVKAKALTENFTAGGTVNVYLVWRRLTPNATIAAR